MRKINIFFLLIILTLFLSNASAFFPITHEYIQKQLNNVSIDSNLWKVCKDYPALCASGNSLTDASVLFYYTEKNKYIYTHSTSFCVSLLNNANSQQELACAVGSCEHLSTDLISHTQMVTYCIEKSKLPNNFAHPFCEQHLDNIILSKNPSLKQNEITSLNSYQTCVPLFKRVLQGSKEYKNVDIDVLFSKYISEVQGSKTGYDASFSNISALPVIIIGLYLGITLSLLVLDIFLIRRKKKTLLNWISLVIVSLLLFYFVFLFIANMFGRGFETLVFAIKPLSNLFPIGDAHGVVNQAVENSKQFFLNGESFLYNKEASGTIPLANADASIRNSEYFILSLIFIGILVFIYFNFRKRKV